MGDRSGIRKSRANRHRNRHRDVCGIVGDYNPLHINEEFCKQTQFGGRIAHGPLVYAIAAGLLFQLHLYDDTLIAFLGFDSLKFTQPVKPGDTIHARIKVLEKRETSDAKRA